MTLDTPTSDHAATIAELRALLGARLVTVRAEREAQGRCETWYPLTPPDAVAWPESTAEVSAILRICQAHRCPVVACGALARSRGNTWLRQAESVSISDG